MSMFLPKVDKPQTVEVRENRNILQEKDRLRGQNYYYRSHLSDLEVHKEQGLDILDRLKQLDSENRRLNNINNELRSGNIELKSCLRTLADERFEPKIVQTENDRLKHSFLLMKHDTARLQDKMKDKLVTLNELAGRKLKATLN